MHRSLYKKHLKRNREKVYSDVYYSLTLVILGIAKEFVIEDDATRNLSNICP